MFADTTIAAITNNADINVGSALTPQALNLAQWRGIVPGAVATVAFGTYRTLDFTTRPSGHIAPIPTRTGTLAAISAPNAMIRIARVTGRLSSSARLKSLPRVSSRA